MLTDVGPVSSTTDPEVAKAKVRALKAVGGGDCPELSMQGLYQALIYSLPDSRIFLFTDADAKDAHLEPSVLSIAREKSCIIDPVLTGSCSRKRKKRSLPGGSLYERLATATGGQVLKYSKGDVKKVVELIKSEVNSTHSGSSAPSHKVTLLAIERKRSATKHPLSVQCDSSILSMIVVLSAASSPIIEVEPPEGNVICQAGYEYSVKQTPKRSILVPKIRIQTQDKIEVIFRLYYTVIVKPNIKTR